MATVRMKKGVMFADIYDSPETIRQAQLDGYSFVEEKKVVEPEKVVTAPAEEEKKIDEIVEPAGEVISKIVHGKKRK